jgi:hypothetical protein
MHLGSADRTVALMLFEILAHICVPLAAVACLILFKAATREKPVGWENCNEVALELAILAIGSTGGIFANPSLIKHLGENAGVYGILVVLIDLALAAIVVYRGRFRTADDETSWIKGTVDLFLGCLCVAITSGVIYKSY